MSNDMIRGVRDVASEANSSAFPKPLPFAALRHIVVSLGSILGTTPGKGLQKLSLHPGELSENRDRPRPRSPWTDRAFISKRTYQYIFYRARPHSAFRGSPLGVSVKKAAWVRSGPRQEDGHQLAAAPGHPVDPNDAVEWQDGLAP